MEQVDHKMLAAGEREELQENLQERLYHAAKILDNLLTFAAVPNKPQEEQAWAEWKLKWMQRLLTVPQWKLNRWDEYKGEFVTGIWEFFDNMRQLPQAYTAPELPEPKSNIARDSLKHIKAILAFEGPRKEKRAFEKTGLQVLHKKYPNAGFGSALHTREQEWSRK